MAGIRMHMKDAIHFVTNRCEQEQFLLLPSEAINALIFVWLARALTFVGGGIEIYAIVFLSNHFHILLRDTGGRLAEFMGYFQGNLAKAINKELGRRGKFFIFVDGAHWRGENGRGQDLGMSVANLNRHNDSRRQSSDESPFRLQFRLDPCGSLGFAGFAAGFAGIEATLSELKRSHGMGKLRFRRRPRVPFATARKVTACNIKRWLKALSLYFLL